MNWEWTGIAPALRDAGFRTVAVDQRGHGQSDKPHEPETLRTTIGSPDDVSAVLDDLGVERCVLIRLLDGRLHGAAHGRTAEPRVHALVLGGIGDTAPKDWDRENVAHALEADELSEDHEGEARAIREYADATGADRLALAAIQRGRTEEPFALDAITVPTLVIVGEDDELAGDAERTRPCAGRRERSCACPAITPRALIEPAFIAALVELRALLSTAS